MQETALAAKGKDTDRHTHNKSKKEKVSTKRVCREEEKTA